VTTGGFHGALALDVPLYGGPTEGGIAIRLAGRLLVTPEARLGTSNEFQEPIASGQVYAGIAYIP
jgi:hypothetical protein